MDYGCIEARVPVRIRILLVVMSQFSRSLPVLRSLQRVSPDSFETVHKVLGRVVPGCLLAHHSEAVIGDKIGASIGDLSSCIGPQILVGIH